MSRKRTAYLVLAALMTVVFGFVWMISPQWSRTNSGTVTIEGNMPGALNEAQLVGHNTNPKQMDVVLGLKLRNEAELDDLINRQSDPTSPDFRKFIMPDEFVGRFAPTKRDVDKLVDFLQQQKLEVVEVAPNRLLIHVRGTVTQIEKAFSVRINTYSVGPKEAFSNDRNPSVPAEFKDVVQSVIGLNSFAEFHKRLVRRAPTTPPAAAARGG